MPVSEKLKECKILKVHITVMEGTVEERALFWLDRELDKLDGAGVRRLSRINVSRNIRGGKWRWLSTRKRVRSGYVREGDAWVDTDLRFPTVLTVATGAKNATVPEKVEARVMNKSTWWSYAYEKVEVSSMADFLVFVVSVVGWFSLRKEKKVPSEGAKCSYPAAYRHGLKALENWRKNGEGGGLWD